MVGACLCHCFYDTLLSIGKELKRDYDTSLYVNGSKYVVENNSLN